MARKMIVSNGGKMCRKYILDIKRKNKTLGLHIKHIKRKDKKTGEVVAEYTYYYTKVKRSEEEVQELLASGKKLTNTVLYFKDKYIGKEKPPNYEEDLLSRLAQEQKIQINRDDMITDEETLRLILKELPEYFNKKTIQAYFLNQ